MTIMQLIVIQYFNQLTALHNICVCAVYIYYVYINTHTYMYIFKKICYVYTLNIYDIIYINIYICNYIHVNICINILHLNW